MSTAALDATLPNAPQIAGNRLSQLRDWLRDPLDFLERAHREYGDVVGSRTAREPIVHLFHPDHIQHILVNNAGNYTKDTRGYRAIKLGAGLGLVTSQGELWKRQRRIVNPAFHRKNLATMADAMVECTDDLATEWAAQGDTPRDVAEDMVQLTLRIACRTFFSADVGSRRGDRIAHAGTALVSMFLFHMAVPFPWPEYLPTPGNLKFWRAVRALDEEVYALVAERRADPDPPPDLLSMLLNAVDDETGQGMSDRQLRDELVTLLVAGHETTANGLAFALHLLATNPDWLHKVQGELDEVLGGRLPTGADFPKLDLTHRAFSEAIRLFPPAWVTARRCASDDVIGGYAVSEGSFTIVSPWVTHRDPAWWPDPLRYDPDRFLPEAVKSRPKLAYFPFAAGARKCIGDRFAQMEAVLILATLLQRFDLEPTSTDTPALAPGLTLRPKDGIWQRLEPRGTTGAARS